jgi:hypothetical protein
MAGGNDDSASGLMGQDTVTDDRGGRGPGTEIYLDAITGDYLGGGGGEVLGGKAGIIADDNAPPGQSLLFQEVGDALGTVAYVFKGKVLGDNRPPAVGAELDGIFSRCQTAPL